MAKAKAMRSELLNFRVTPEEKKLIEKRASSKKMAVAEYVREAVIMDMLLSGMGDAWRFLGRKAYAALREELETRMKQPEGEPGTRKVREGVR